MNEAEEPCSDSNVGVVMIGVGDKGPKSDSFGSELEAKGDALFLGPAMGMGIGVPMSR
jgi:hypothetical protein